MKITKYKYSTLKWLINKLNAIRHCYLCVSHKIRIHTICFIVLNSLFIINFIVLSKFRVIKYFSSHFSQNTISSFNITENLSFYTRFLIWKIIVFIKILFNLFSRLKCWNLLDVLKKILFYVNYEKYLKYFGKLSKNTHN